MRTRFFQAVSASLLAVAAASAATVTVSLSSAQNGQTIAAGSTVNWSISFTVSAGDNAGLALLSADLTQADTNPALINLPQAGSVPAAMANFARPAGISNPNNGYQGSQRGTAGAQNLIQIGGGQNTFGTARPAGTGIAESANVVGGVGQSGSVVLASGSFTAPATEGAYSYSIENVIANVLQQRNDPPAFSPVIQSTVSVAAPTISFTVGGVQQPGDVDGDGDVDLTDLATLLTNFGTPSGATRGMGDLDGDGDVDLTDLATLLSNFGL